MTITEFEPLVYVVLGIDENEHDQVLAVCHTYDDAKRYCTRSLVKSRFYDVWIEKHPVISY